MDPITDDPCVEHFELFMTIIYPQTIACVTGAKGLEGVECKKEKKGSPLLLFLPPSFLSYSPPTPPTPLLTPTTQATQILIIRPVNVKPFDISLPQNDKKKKMTEKFDNDQPFL